MTSRSAQKLARIKTLAHCETINTVEQPAWAQAVLALTGGRGAEHIIETIGGENLTQSVSALTGGGRIAQIGFLNGPEITLSALPLILRRAVIQGISVGHRRAIEKMMDAFAHKGIRPVIDHVYGFRDVPAAFQHLDRGPFGKVVIRIAP